MENLPRPPFPQVIGRSQVARLVEDLDDDTIIAIACSSVPSAYAELDKLIQDWTP